MNQSVFIEELQKNLEAADWEGLSKREVKELCEILGDTIIVVLKKKPPTGKNIVAVVPGVGRFTKINKPARWGFKPFTDPPEKMKFAAKKALRVTPAKSIKDALNPPKAKSKPKPKPKPKPKARKR